MEVGGETSMQIWVGSVVVIFEVVYLANADGTDAKRYVKVSHMWLRVIFVREHTLVFCDMQGVLYSVLNGTNIPRVHRSNM